ncbi:MAG: methylamine utilization protein [Betaproteobacteria bacterium]
MTSRHCPAALLARMIILSLAGLSSTAFAAKVMVQVSTPGGGGVANAGVYAKAIGAPPASAAIREISIEQINKEFVPLVSIAQTGALMNLPNRDAIRHHVYSFSPAKTFEIKLYSGVPSKPVLLDKPGDVVLGCNIHDNMIAYVLVVDTPYFAKTDSKGRAVLDGLPAGDYELAMWYPGGAAVPAPQKLKLGAADNSDVKFSFTSRLISPRPGAPAVPATGK